MICNICKKDKPISEFSVDKSQKLGIRHRCKSCMTLRNRIRRNGTTEYKRNYAIKSDGIKKQCPKCREIKLLSEFNKSSTTKDGQSTWCKMCVRLNAKKWQLKNKEISSHQIRVRSLKNKFGLTIEDYEKLLKQQSGKCALCGKDKGNSNGIRLAVDHDHKTGKIRGLLCWSCNAGLGLLGDNIVSMKRVIDYLEEYV